MPVCAVVWWAIEGRGSARQGILRRLTTMEMEITFPGGARVDANFGGMTVKTDQPVQGGGQGSSPKPFATFLASIGSCACIYLLDLCQQRCISTNRINIVQRMHS